MFKTLYHFDLQNEIEKGASIGQSKINYKSKFNFNFSRKKFKVFSIRNNGR